RQIEVYASMEIDYIDEDHNPANDYFQSLDLDYSIGSVHFIKVGPQEVFDADTRPESFIKSLLLYYDNDLRRLVCDYFDAKMRMVALGGFDFVGHADKISMNASRVEPGITQKVWYKRKVQEYFSFIAQRGMMLELNTKAYDSSGYLFPNAQNLRMLCQMGIPLVVNSDSHRPELINSGRMASIELLREVGYKAIMEFHNNQWHEQEI
ncbi:MAG: PHP domain-containing protein, partial [Mucinivorans sp.]